MRCTCCSTSREYPCLVRHPGMRSGTMISRRPCAGTAPLPNKTLTNRQGRAGIAARCASIAVQDHPARRFAACGRAHAGARSRGAVRRHPARAGACAGGLWQDDHAGAASSAPRRAGRRLRVAAVRRGRQRCVALRRIRAACTGRRGILERNAHPTSVAHGAVGQLPACDARIEEAATIAEALVHGHHLDWLEIAAQLGPLLVGRALRRFCRIKRIPQN